MLSSLELSVTSIFTKLFIRCSMLEMGMGMDSVMGRGGKQGDGLDEHG